MKGLRDPFPNHTFKAQFYCFFPSSSSSLCKLRFEVLKKRTKNGRKLVVGQQRSKLYTTRQHEQLCNTFVSNVKYIQPEVGSHFAVNQLCKLQHDAKDKVKQGEGIVGFQWKPIHYGLSHEYGIGALQEIATHVDPVIRVIHLTRNPLDRLISNRKHISSSKTNKKIEAHCADGDEECIKEHHEHETHRDRKIVET